MATFTAMPHETCLKVYATSPIMGGLFSLCTTPSELYITCAGKEVPLLTSSIIYGTLLRDDVDVLCVRGRGKIVQRSLGGSFWEGRGVSVCVRAAGRGAESLPFCTVLCFVTRFRLRLSGARSPFASSQTAPFRSIKPFLSSARHSPLLLSLLCCHF